MLISLDYIALIDTFVKPIVVFVVIISIAAFLTLSERVLLGRMQKRYGPNRAGPFGLLQPFADLIKFITKQPFLPRGGNKLLYQIAPIFSIFAAFAMWLIIPLGAPIKIGNHVLDLQFIHLDSGMIYLIIISNLGTYGIVLAGLSSDSRFSLYGALRGTAQNISYGILISLVLLTVISYNNGALSPEKIIAYQEDKIWNIIPLFSSAVLYFIAMLAETNRQPFDLPESEGELIAGYNIEYGGMKFGLFYLSEYINLVSGCAVFAVLFLGGYSMPFSTIAWLTPFYLFGKVFILIFFIILIRASFPRIKYVDLMKMSWIVMIPLQLCALLAVSFKGVFSMNPYLLGGVCVIEVLLLSRFTELILRKRRQSI